MPVALRLPSTVYQATRRHLLPTDSRLEQGGFMFARYAANGDGDAVFTYIDWIPLGPGDYAEQHRDYLELTDAARGRIIKRAHDLGTCLVELHSHPGPYPAAFSLSDMHGFQDFVPHVRWRLQGKPYGAVVVAPSGFDALAWVEPANAPGQLHAIETDAGTLHATGLTLRNKEGVHHGAL